ncbi:hypothetical protein P3L10_026578 [Capsicum annuum]
MTSEIIIISMAKLGNMYQNYYNNNILKSVRSPYLYLRGREVVSDRPPVQEKNPQSPPKISYRSAKIIRKLALLEFVYGHHLHVHHVLLFPPPSLFSFLLSRRNPSSCSVYRDSQHHDILGKNCSTDHDADSSASSRKRRAESDTESLSRACNEWQKISTAVSFLIFMTLVIFQIILDGHFAIILPIFVQDLGFSLVGEAEISPSQDDARERPVVDAQ